MDHEKIVSVGVPVFNGERFLRNALQSLLDQDYPYLEIIISDNSSTDGTANICKEFMSKDKRIKYSRNSCNIGGAANFNKLIDAASGEYFMWFACDDLLKQNYVSKLIQLLDDKSNSIAFCIPNAIDENGKFLGDAPKFKQLVGKNKFDGLCRFLLQGEIWGKANITYGLMRRKQIQKTKGFKTWGWGEWGGGYAPGVQPVNHGETCIARGNFILQTHHGLYEANIPDCPKNTIFWGKNCIAVL